MVHPDQEQGLLKTIDVVIGIHRIAYDEHDGKRRDSFLERQS